MKTDTEILRLIPSLVKTFRHLAPYVRKRRMLLAGSFGSLFVSTGMRLLEPWPLKFLFDGVIGQKSGGVVNPLPGVDTLTLITLCAIAVVVVTVLRAMAEFTTTVGFAKAGNAILMEVRSDLYRHIQSLSLSFHAKARGGDLMLRVMSDVNVLRDIAVTALMPMIASGLVLTGMISVMLWMNWRLALLSLLTVPLFGLAAARLTTRIRTAARGQRKQEGALAATATESIGAIRVVKAYALEGQFSRGFDERSAAAAHGDVKLSRLSAALERSVDILIAISTALVVLYGGRLVLRGQLTPGDLIVFFTYLKRAFNPVQDFAKYTGRLAKASAAGERVIELFDIEPEIRDLPDAVEAPPFRGEVRFENVSFGYGGETILRELTFDIRPGEKVAIVGPSGIGKSTLTSLLIRLYDPTAGAIVIDSLDIRKYTIESLGRQIGIVMQDSVLFAASIRDNIAFGRAGATAEDVEQAARVASADEFIRRLPEGYETMVGERGVTLSGGERQRIAIARAAIRNAPILVLDEPTTGLDEENERAVMESLETLSRGRTTFIISHDLRLAARAHRVLYLEGGRILEQGDHASLMASNGRYADLFNLQMAGNRSHDSRDTHAVTT